jgi:NADH-quinone oxidoreductase subunit M
LWIFLAFSSLAIKIHLFLSILGKQMCTKAPAVGTMLLSGIMLKMGLYSIIHGNCLSLHLQLEYMYIFISLGIAGVIWFHSCFTPKDLKLLAYSSLAHVGLIAAGTYTLTIDGLRGAVCK